MTEMFVSHNMRNMHNMQNIQPPARSLYTWMGPGGRYASASHIEANNDVVVFPPDRRMIAGKSNGGRAGGCCRMGGPF